MSNKENKADVVIEHDLAIGIMNLIAIEEHLFFTGAKTEKTHYYDMISEIREMRKELLKKIIKEYEGEIWCTSKHLLTASMRMMEVGTKEQTLGNHQAAYDFFAKSYNLYMMFWSLNLNQKKDITNQNFSAENLIENINKVKSVITEKLFEQKEHNSQETESEQKNVNRAKSDVESKFSLSNIKKFVSEKLDCCRE